LSKKKTFFITFIFSVAFFTIILGYFTNLSLEQYIHSLFFTGIKGNHSFSTLLSLAIGYINNYFLIIFIASSILIAFKLLSNIKTFFPVSKIVFYGFYYFIFFYFLHFFYYYFGSNGYGNEIFLVLFLTGLLSYCQSNIKKELNSTIDYYFLSIICRLRNNIIGSVLMIVILFTPILAAIGTINDFSFAILPYLVLISVPVLGISHRSKNFHLNKFLLLGFLLLLLYKGFYMGYLKKPYSVFISENKISENIEYSKLSNLRGIEVGPVLTRQITFTDSVFKSNEYQKGDTMITFNFCDGFPLIFEARILFSPIGNEADSGIYSILKTKLIAINKLYLIDQVRGKISDTTTLQKLGISPGNIRKIGSNSVLSLFVYKRHW
jgi:hypothetical protein